MLHLLLLMQPLHSAAVSNGPLTLLFKVYATSNGVVYMHIPHKSTSMVLSTFVRSLGSNIPGLPGTYIMYIL